MKAVIVADNESVIANVSQVLKLAGYDVIVYRWLLKALDNIEEIAPHLIVVSSQDYPRHWKTLAQFVETKFGDYTPQVILYTGGELSDEDAKKADALHIRGAFDSVGVEGLDQLREIIVSVDDIFSGDFGEKEVTINPLSVEDEMEAEELSAEDEAKEEMDVPTVDALLSDAEDFAEEADESVTEGTFEEEADEPLDQSLTDGSFEPEMEADEASDGEEAQPEIACDDDDDFDEHFFDEDDVPSAGHRESAAESPEAQGEPVIEAAAQEPVHEAEIEEEVDSFIDSEIIGDEIESEENESAEAASDGLSLDDILKQNVSYDEKEIKWSFAEEEAYAGQEDLSDYDDIDMSEISLPVVADEQAQESFQEAEIFASDDHAASAMTVTPAPAATVQAPAAPVASAPDMPVEEAAGREVRACTLMLTNPQTGAVVFGRARNFDGQSVSFTPDSPLSLPEGTVIPFTSVKTSDSMECYEATVVSSGDVLVLNLSLSA